MSIEHGYVKSPILLAAEQVRAGILHSALVLSLALFVAGHLLAAASQSQVRRQILVEEIPSEDQRPILSGRMANYRIDARLDPDSRIVHGRLLLTWNNRTGSPQREFHFHLYLNAFRNNRSTFVQESGFRSLWPNLRQAREEDWGFTHIHSLHTESQALIGAPEVAGLEFIQPDDSNPFDRTLLQVRLTEPVGPDQSIRFRIEFTSKLPRGIARTGWAPDYFFAAQWFPKVAGWQDGWAGHQYHLNTEYFANFGVFDVSLTLPAGFEVGATGRQLSRRDNQDGTQTVQFVQEDVHDFAWAASPRFLLREERFEEPELPPVDLKLLVLPENRRYKARYLDAARHSLRLFGKWFGPYPYETLTIVDPAFRSDTDGMEYPTLIVGRAHFWSPLGTFVPESVTVHEVGHQWFYGLVASNEFREPWLDEGLTSWAQLKVLDEVYGPRIYYRRFLSGFPVLFPQVEIPHETASLALLRSAGTIDPMVRLGWEYLSRDSYRLNAYRRPALTLLTLERHLGTPQMMRAVREYVERFRFRHPTTRDLINVLSESAGQDLKGFFEQTFFEPEVVDYAVDSALCLEVPSKEGFFDENGEPAYQEPVVDATEPFFRCEAVIRRLGGARLPVEVRFVFADGSEALKRWQGQDRWERFTFYGRVPLQFVVVDPHRKLLLDVDPVNNSRWVHPVSRNASSRAALRWTAHWMFWLQNLLETFTFLG